MFNVLWPQLHVLRSKARRKKNEQIEIHENNDNECNQSTLRTNMPRQIYLHGK